MQWIDADLSVTSEHQCFYMNRVYAMDTHKSFNELVCSLLKSSAFLLDIQGSFVWKNPVARFCLPNWVQ